METGRDDASDGGASDFCDAAFSEIMVPELPGAHAHEPGPLEAPAPTPNANAPKRDRPAKKFAALGVVGVSRQRTPTEHKLVCERMRACKRQRVAEAEKSDCHHAMEGIMESSGRVVRKTILDRRFRPGRGNHDRLVKTLRKFKRFAGKGNASFQVSSDKLLRIAFDEGLRQNDVARSQSVAVATVTEARAVTAYVCQKLHMADLNAWLNVASREPPACAILLRKYDEARTKLRLSLRLQGGLQLTTGQQCVPSDILQCRRRLILAWNDKVVEVNVPSPPVPVTSTSAEALKGALELAPQSKAAQAVCMEIMSKATFSSIMDCSDGAYGNRKYGAHQEATQEGCSYSMLPCGNHKTALCEEALVAGLGKSWKKNMFDFIGYLRTGMNFLRLATVTRPLIDEFVVFAPEEPPATAVQLAELVTNHMVVYRDEYKSAYVEGRSFQAAPQARSRSRATWGRFADSFSSLYGQVESGDDGEIIVYTGGKTWASKPRAEQVLLLAETLLQTVLAALPLRPEDGKWTLLAPAVDWFVGCQLASHLLTRLVRAAFKHVPATVIHGVQRHRAQLLAERRFDIGRCPRTAG